MFYWSGPFPYDPWWGYTNFYVGPVHHGGGDDCNCCDCRCCAGICRPVGWMLYVFPVMPQNAWGGLAGWLMGTRALTPEEDRYQGGSCLVDFLGMGWRRQGRDLHGEDGWRLLVYEYLQGPIESGGNGGQPGSPARVNTGSLPGPGRGSASPGAGIVRVAGNICAIPKDGPFEQRADNLVPSSFEDYQNNHCWICQDGHEEWDLWIQCGHLFCSKCSTEMLKRRMPCPLCRTYSTTVMRGKKYGAARAVTSTESINSAEPLLPAGPGQTPR